MMGKLRRHKCDWPPCEERSTPGVDRFSRRRWDGECDKHGHWETCNFHSEEDRSGSGTWGVPVFRCPMCSYEEHQQDLADKAEAERRNNSRPPSPYPAYVKEYKRQGHGQEAAEALAHKRLREDPPLPTKHWDAQDIRRERAEQERQKKIQQGALAVCPSCRKDVRVSEGIVLSHQVGTGVYGADPSGFRARGEEIRKTCPGTGCRAPG